MPLVAIIKLGTLEGLPGITWRKVGMTSNHHAPSTPPDKTEGLEHLIAVAQEAFVALKPGGLLLMEHGYAQGAAIKVLLESHKWENVLILKDLSGHDRVASARKPAA